MFQKVDKYMFNLWLNLLTKAIILICLQVYFE
jgi:hypothetical protein